MTTLTKIQISVLASYGAPFVLIIAIGLNILLSYLGLSSSQFKLVLLSASFPIGFGIGKVIYMHRSNVQIKFDQERFQVIVGGKERLRDKWANYRLVSIHLDQYGRPDLRLYKTYDDDFDDLPISRTNAKPQEFRDQVKELLARKESAKPSLQVAEVG